MRMTREESKKEGWEPVVRPTTLEQEKQVIKREVKLWDRRNIKANHKATGVASNIGRAKAFGKL